MKKFLLTIALLTSFVVGAQALDFGRNYTALLFTGKYSASKIEFKVGSTGQVCLVDDADHCYTPDQFCTVNNSNTTVYITTRDDKKESVSFVYTFTKDVKNNQIFLNVCTVSQSPGEDPDASHYYGFILEE